jgi:hypothetical protein
MKKLTMVAMLAIIALLGLSSAAVASTIEVTNLGAETLNVETQGRITFTSPAATIICDKTMIGRLEPRATGTLGLGGNRAGEIGEIRLNNCRGGTARSLNTLANPVRLSWVRVTNGGVVELAGSNARFLIEAIFVSCLYTAEMVGRASPETGGLYRERLELRLLREGVGGTIVADPNNSSFCPKAEEVEMRGSLTVTRPTVGVGVSLR